MEMSKLCAPVETAAKSTEVLKPISEIAKLISNEYLKKVELNEYCKIVESDLTRFQNKVQMLLSAKNESARVKADYKSRNKINDINSKSLRQALNELYKYKAEMKSCYIATEKALKLKRIKYNKIVADYDSAWKEALKEYNADLVFVELLEIQKDNKALEKEIETQEKLSACTGVEFKRLKENIEKDFYKKIVEFSKAVIQHKEFSKSNYQIKEGECLKTQPTGGGFEFKIFRPNVPPFRKVDTSDDVSIGCTVDVSIFDDIMVPSENLESQNMEDDGYSFAQNDGKHFSDVSKDQEEDLEYLNNYQQNKEQKNKELKHLKMNPVQDSSKAATVEENESQYFKQQTSEGAENENPKILEQKSFIEENYNKQRNDHEKFDNDDREAKKINSVNKESAAALLMMESEDDAQMECEESVSERSYEKQFGNQKGESYEYQKASSISSEDFPSGENQNESVGPSFKSFTDDQSNRLKPRPEREKSEFKSFPGFFTMGDDHETPAPSIFKLF